MIKPKTRIGADIGGTFTDVVLERDGALISAKILTTHSAPEEGLVAGVVNVCAQAGIFPGDVDQIVHGTTLATNALIERRGARTALVTTQGFRDVIEMRTESRFDQYDLNLKIPAPLIPRDRRFTLSERIAADGAVLAPIDDAEIRALAKRLIAAGIESVAVGFLHSYANGAHEARVRAVFEELAPLISVSLSSEVSPQMREYERFNTVVANAYIKPMMMGYINRLRDRLVGAGATCPVFLMHSGGGVISVESAAAFPVRLVESGPAGGAVFAADVAARYGLDKALSFDMGGTTAKICLIKNKAPKTARVFEVARTDRFKKGSGMPISIPVIDMVEIGAGGGSLARVDAMRQVRVGPASAGSEPGPACYGRGGDRPAVTDADLVLGRLDADYFAGGAMTLDIGRAEAALRRDVGEPLALDALEAAVGVCEMVDENMANAARMHAVENGEDLSSYTMIAFGGAAPLHAARLCEKLGVARLIVPQGAGVGSAIGFLRAPFSYEATRSAFMKLSAFDPARARTVFAALEEETTAFVRSCGVEDEITTAYKLYMRYAGQGSEIPVTLSPDDALNPDAQRIRRLFETAYASLFSRTVEGMDVEITVWAVAAATPAPIAAATAPVERTQAAETTMKRDIFDVRHGVAAAGVFHRDALAAGDVIAGPATIAEDETTIIVPLECEAVMRADGCADIRLAKPENAS